MCQQLNAFLLSLTGTVSVSDVGYVIGHAASLTAVLWCWWDWCNFHSYKKLAWLQYYELLCGEKKNGQDTYWYTWKTAEQITYKIRKLLSGCVCGVPNYVPAIDLKLKIN